MIFGQTVVLKMVLKYQAGVKKVEVSVCVPQN